MTAKIIYSLLITLGSCTLFAADLPTPQTHTGTPRVFTEKERAQIDKYLQGYHNKAAHDFGEQMGFGAVRMIRFDPQILFHWLGTPDVILSGIRPGKDTFITPQIELLGRLDNKAPVVYKNPLPTAKGAEHLRSESLGHKDGKPMKVTPPPAGKLKDTPTRELLPAEIAGLKKLQSGEALHWEQTGNEIRAVGALVAKKDCAECHATKENALLGALTYRFTTDQVVNQIRMIEEYEAKDAELRKNRLK